MFTFYIFLCEQGDFNSNSEPRNTAVQVGQARPRGTLILAAHCDHVSLFSIRRLTMAWSFTLAHLRSQNSRNAIETAEAHRSQH